MPKHDLAKKKVIGLFLMVAISVGMAWWLFADNQPHNPKVFGPPTKTQWKPVGAQAAGQHGYDIIPNLLPGMLFTLTLPTRTVSGVLPRPCTSSIG